MPSGFLRLADGPVPAVKDPHANPPGVRVVPGVAGLDAAGVNVLISAAITALIDNAPTNSDTLGELAAILTAALANVYTKTQTDSAINSHVPDLSGYATTVAVNDGLNYVLAVIDALASATNARLTAIEGLPRVLGAGDTVPDGTGYDVDDLFYDTSTE